MFRSFWLKRSILIPILILKKGLKSDLKHYFSSLSCTSHPSTLVNSVKIPKYFINLCNICISNLNVVGKFLMTVENVLKYSKWWPVILVDPERPKDRDPDPVSGSFDRSWARIVATLSVDQISCSWRFGQIILLYRNRSAMPPARPIPFLPPAISQSH